MNVKFWLSSALKILNSRAGIVLAYHKKTIFFCLLFIATPDVYNFQHGMTYDLGNKSINTAHVKTHQKKLHPLLCDEVTWQLQLLSQAQL